MIGNSNKSHRYELTNLRGSVVASASMPEDHQPMLVMLDTGRHSVNCVEFSIIMRGEGLWTIQR